MGVKKKITKLLCFRTEFMTRDNTNKRHLMFKSTYALMFRMLTSNLISISLRDLYAYKNPFHRIRGHVFGRDKRKFLL